MTIQETAASFAPCFEFGTRSDGETFRRLKADAPEGLRDLVRSAHGDALPDDWRYECIENALQYIAENPHEEDAAIFAEGETDVYTSNLLAWVASGNGRVGYVDDAIREFGPAVSLDGLLRSGQYAEAYEVFGLVWEALADLAEDEPADPIALLLEEEEEQAQIAKRPSH